MKVVEFMGMPRAGKTTALEAMESYLKMEGARVRVVYEGARICPLDKSDRFNYNSWSFHNTINRILEARLDHYDFILIDRGVIDHMAFSQAICSRIQKDSLPNFSYYQQFVNLQDLEIFFYVNPDESIRRESKNKPFIGRVFNSDFLRILSQAYRETVGVMKDQYGREIKIFDGNSPIEKNISDILDLSKQIKSQ